jgi:NO-binding membrane sensor protein with MHYT domain
VNHTDVQQFAMGMWTLVLACATSVVGSLIGMSCMSRARRTRTRDRRVLWTVLGAFAIGGVAVWLAHFIAMLGFAVTDSDVRYSVPLTVLSAVASTAVDGSGLSIITLIRFDVPRRLAAGAICGVGVALAHHLGLAAVQFQGDISYDPVLVAVSVAIAVVAATAAFWFTGVASTTAATVVSGLLLGLAVTGMHYTGMAAVRVHVDLSQPAPDGVNVFDLVFPVFVTSGVVIAAVLWALFTSVAEPARAPDTPAA